MDPPIEKFRPYLSDIKVSHILKKISKTEKEASTNHLKLSIYEIVLGIIALAASYYTGFTFFGAVGGALFFAHCMKQGIRNFLPAALGFVKFWFTPLFPPLAVIPSSYLALKFVPESVSEKFMDREHLSSLAAKKALEWYAIAKQFKIQTSKEAQAVLREAITKHEKVEAVELPSGIIERIIAKFKSTKRDEERKALKELKEKADKKIEEIENKVRESVFKTLKRLQRTFRKLFASAIRAVGTAMSAIGRVLSHPIAILAIIIGVSVYIVYYSIAVSYNVGNLYYTYLLAIIGPILLVASVITRVLAYPVATVIAFIIFEFLVQLSKLIISYFANKAKEAAQAYAEAADASKRMVECKPSFDEEIAYQYKQYSSEVQRNIFESFKNTVEGLRKQGMIGAQDKEKLIADFATAREPEEFQQKFMQLFSIVAAINKQMEQAQAAEAEAELAQEVEETLEEPGPEKIEIEQEKKIPEQKAQVPVAPEEAPAEEIKPSIDKTEEGAMLKQAESMGRMEKDISKQRIAAILEGGKPEEIPAGFNAKGFYSYAKKFYVESGMSIQEILPKIGRYALRFVIEWVNKLTPEQIQGEFDYFAKDHNESTKLATALVLDVKYGINVAYEFDPSNLTKSEIESTPLFMNNEYIAGLYKEIEEEYREAA